MCLLPTLTKATYFVRLISAVVLCQHTITIRRRIGEGRNKVVGIHTCGRGFPSAETSWSGRQESQSLPAPFKKQHNNM